MSALTFARPRWPLYGLLLSALLCSCATHVNVPVTVVPQSEKASLITAMTKAKQDLVTPDDALKMLKDGNIRFVSDNMLGRSLISQEKASGKDGQFPFASIVACIDSRSDPALVFDQGIGDLFVARVAGNIVNPDILGSLEYAAKVAGSKVIVVLGHTHCGAVKGACDSVKMGNLTQLVEKISPAVKATPVEHGGDRSSKNHHFVDAVAEMNVNMTVKAITKKSPVLKELASKGQIKIVGALLDVETGLVEFY